MTGRAGLLLRGVGVASAGPGRRHSRRARLPGRSVPGCRGAGRGLEIHDLVIRRISGLGQPFELALDSCAAIHLQLAIGDAAGYARARLKFHEVADFQVTLYGSVDYGVVNADVALIVPFSLRTSRAWSPPLPSTLPSM